MKRKKTTLDDYREFISKRGGKFDELALMFFAKAASCHIGIINVDNTMWTMCKSGLKDDCHVLFLNRGKLLFELVEEADVDTEDEKLEEKEDPSHQPEDEELGDEEEYG